MKGGRAVSFGNYKPKSPRTKESMKTIKNSSLEVEARLHLRKVMQKAVDDATEFLNHLDTASQSVSPIKLQYVIRDGEGKDSSHAVSTKISLTASLAATLKEEVEAEKNRLLDEIQKFEDKFN